MKEWYVTMSVAFELEDNEDIRKYVRQMLQDDMSVMDFEIETMEEQ